jgi:hypothetical protein
LICWIILWLVLAASPEGLTQRCRAVNAVTKVQRSSSRIPNVSQSD